MNYNGTSLKKSILDLRMPSTPTSKSLAERVLDAETKSSQWLAEANQAQESGRFVKAERGFKKAQFWLDRANHLSGQGDIFQPKKESPVHSLVD